MFEEYAYCEWIQTFFVSFITLDLDFTDKCVRQTLMCTKVSICFFLLRLPSSRKHIIPLYISIAILIVSNVIITFLWIFQCNPVDAVWTYGVSGNCFSHEQLLDIILAQAIISVVSDFGLAFYPILVLRNLKLTQRRQKLGLVVLMGLGVITGACCIVRTVLNDQSLPTDATYGGIDNWFWRTFEVNLGIICACIPTVVPFYKWVKKMAKGRNGSSTKQRTQETKEIIRDEEKQNYDAEHNETVGPSNSAPRTREPDQSLSYMERAYLGREV